MFPAPALRLRLRVFFALCIAFGTSFAAVPAAGRLAMRVGAVDLPGDPRRIHDHPVPRLGGLAITAGFLAGSLLFGPLPRTVGAVLEGCLLTALIGTADDRWDLRPAAKLTAGCAAALLAALRGVRVSFVTGPGGVLALGPLAVPATVLWIVGMTNAVNLIDGLDGLAAGVGAVSCACMLGVSLCRPEATDGSVLLAALGGACAGFLPYNRSPARIFMGDAGALTLGYVLGCVSVMGLTKTCTAAAVAAPLLILALPLSDTVWAVVRRLRRGESPFRADRGHIHHRLLALGLSPPQAAAVLVAASAVTGLGAVILSSRGTARGWLLLLSMLIAVTAWKYAAGRTGS